MADIHRIGILTGGGDCPGLNAVIRAVTRTAVNRYGIEVIGIEDGFGGLVNDRSRRIRETDIEDILPLGGTILGTTNRDNPFRFPVKREDGEVEYEDKSDLALSNLRGMGIDALIVTGGDGSLKIGLDLQEKGVRLVGIPKTIDNDLSATDVTFGFDTAVQTATDALDKLHTTAESHHRVMVLEVMGRNAGWIAVMSGIAGGSNIILIPEIPFTFETIVGEIHDRRRRGRRYSIITVAEGTRLPGGEKVTRVSSDGNEIYGGIGAEVAREVEARSGMESRVTVLGHLQRGGTPTSFDRMLATRFGVKAVEMVMDGEFGNMACLCGQKVDSTPIEEAVKELRRVQPDGQIVRFARSVGISFGSQRSSR